VEAAKGDFGILMAGYEENVCAASREDACALGSLYHGAYIEYTSANPLKVVRHCGIGDMEVTQGGSLDFFVDSS
jgi:hypothetical protein